MIDISDLTSGAGAFDKMVADLVLDVTTKTTLDVQRNVVLGTPVGATGNARAGWQAIPPTKPFENGSVENNVHYIVFLINGHSNKAPAGWFDNAISAAIIFGDR